VVFADFASNLMQLVNPNPVLEGTAPIYQSYVDYMNLAKNVALSTVKVYKEK
jgi:hypothetical protein